MAVLGAWEKGSSFRVTFTATPVTGTVSLSDVTLTGTDPSGDVTSHTASVTSPATNTFRLDYAIPVDADDGDHVLVFRSAAPSPVGALTVAYQVLP